MKNINFIDLADQYQAYKTDVDQAIADVLNSGQFILGNEVKTFEQELSSFVGVAHTIGCANGTDALQLALMAIDIQPGDEVITSVFSFFAAAEVIALLGAIPVFVDVDEKTYNIDADKIAEKITSKTKAIVPVSLYGQTADMDKINAIAAQSGQQIYIIEDAAQSLGATYHGKQSGNLSTLATTSFFPSKPLGCYGDGGAVFSQDEALATKIRSLHRHGETKRYEHQYVGINSRLDAIQAAILRIKLQHFPEEIQQRQIAADRYQQLLQSDNMVLPYIAENCTSVYAQYSIRVPDRERVITELKQHDIPTAVHYPKPIHLQPCFAHLGYKPGDFPIAETTAEEIMSLPMSAFITAEQQQYIAEHLLKVVS